MQGGGSLKKPSGYGICSWKDNAKLADKGGDVNVSRRGLAA